MSDDLPTVAHYQSRYLRVTENWIQTQINSVHTARHIVLTKRRANPELFEGTVVHATGDLSWAARKADRLAWNLIGYSPHLRSVTKREGASLLHAWFGYSGVAMLRLARSLDLPLAVSFLGRDLTIVPRRRDPRRYYAPLFSYAAAVIAEGEVAAERLRMLGAPVAKIEIARICVAAAEIEFHERTRAADEPLRVLIAARFTEKKGLTYAVEAFCRLPKTCHALLTIVGGGDDSEARAIAGQLRALVANSRCADRVTFAGRLPLHEVRNLLSSHHILLHPSITARSGETEGGHPVIMTEAAASGMPIIATRHADIPHVVLDGRSGWLCNERDVNQLVDALLEAYKQPDRLTAFGRRARAHVVSHYDIAHSRLPQIYARVIGR